MAEETVAEETVAEETMAKEAVGGEGGEGSGGDGFDGNGDSADGGVVGGRGASVDEGGGGGAEGGGGGDVVAGAAGREHREPTLKRHDSRADARGGGDPAPARAASDSLTNPQRPAAKLIAFGPAHGNTKMSVQRSSHAESSTRTQRRFEAAEHLHGRRWRQKNHASRPVADGRQLVTTVFSMCPPPSALERLGQPHVNSSSSVSSGRADCAAATADT